MKTQVLIRGDVKIMSNLTAWARRAGNTTPAMAAISELFEEKERALFESGGATGRHGAWQEDRAITKESKTAQALYPETLRATDDLFNSLTDSSHPNAIRQIGPGFLRFGTSLGYGNLHFKSWTHVSGTQVPARRPIDFTQKDRQEALIIIDEWIAGRMEAGKIFRAPIRPSMRMIV